MTRQLIGPANQLRIERIGHAQRFDILHRTETVRVGGQDIRLQGTNGEQAIRPPRRDLPIVDFAQLIAIDDPAGPGGTTHLGDLRIGS